MLGLVQGARVVNLLLRLVLLFFLSEFLPLVHQCHAFFSEAGFELSFLEDLVLVLLH